MIFVDDDFQWWSNFLPSHCQIYKIEFIAEVIKFIGRTHGESKKHYLSNTVTGNEPRMFCNDSKRKKIIYVTLIDHFIKSYYKLL